MSKYVFLYKDNSEDRDCVAYVEINQLKKAHTCIDGRFNIHGACYSKSLKEEFNYSDIKTVLTEQEYKALCNYNENKINLTSIIEKLESEENQKLFNEIIEEEKEYLMDEYSLEESDIEQIFNNYYLDYRDRGCIGYIYSDSEDLGYEEAYSLGYINDNDSIASRYFDYEQFGKDLLNDENYLELSDGRVVSLMY